jgi:hypothetical protein
MSWKTCIIAALTVSPLASVGAAQEASWEFTLSPYVWTPGASTSIETGFGTIDADAGVGDVLSATDFAFMGVFEARRGPWSLIADLVYTDLSERQNAPFGALFSRATVETELRVASGYAAYRLKESAQVSVDLMGGFRAVSADLDVRLAPGTLPGQRFNLGDTWIDPVLGGRIRVALNSRWYLTAMADFGGSGGGDDRTWQAVGMLGYQINDRWSVQGGWRHMTIDREIKGRDVEIDLGGPLIGLTARF